MKRSSRLYIIGLASVALVLVVAFLWRGWNNRDATEKAEAPVASRPAVEPPVQTASTPATVLPSPAPAAAPGAVLVPASLHFASFNSWAEKYLAAAPESKAALIVEGEALAKARREEMLNLIKNDPEQALAEVAPYRFRKELPPGIVTHLEEPVSGRGKFTALYYTPLPGQENEVPPTEYRVELNRNVYQASTYGRRLQQSSRSGLALNGIAIGNYMALSQDPVKVMDKAEAEALIASGAREPEPICGVSGKDSTATAQQTYADVGGEIVSFCQASHAVRLNQTLVAAEETLSSAGSVDPGALAAVSSTTLPPAGGSGTQGRKQLLFIPVTFADDPRPPISQDAAQAGLSANNQYFVNASYGSASWISTVTPVVRLPQKKVYYGEYLEQLLPDAVSQVAALGYNSADYYGVPYVLFNPIPGVKFGGRSDGLLNGGIGSITHELGHDFGLGHANYWDVSGKIPIPNNPNNYPFDRDSEIGHSDVNAPFRVGSNGTKSPVEEYGNIYDVMGSGGGHFSPQSKNLMHWLPDQYTRILTISETNRIYAYDTPSITAGRLYALRIYKDAVSTGVGIGRTYWVSYRQGANNPWLDNGVEVLWNNMLLDTTPETTAGKNDSGVVIGRTFNDPTASFYLTPIGKGGGPNPSDKWMDVVVHLGTFPTNEAPTVSLDASSLNVANGATVTFVATASDPNGDLLAYNWDFGDGSFGLNSAVNLKTFPSSGQYVVRCEVSDMKGGVASAKVLVTVGTPTTFTITGRVTDIEGNPVQGVRVHNGGTLPPYTAPPEPGLPATPPPAGTDNYRYSYTDSQGYYTIGNVPPGLYECGAFIYGYKTEPQDFYNPVNLASANAVGVNFLATPLPRVNIAWQADASEASEDPGVLVVSRTGDVSSDLRVRYQLGGTAVQGFDYATLMGSITTNQVRITNGNTITTNFVAVTNAIGNVVIPAGFASTEVNVVPITNSFYGGTKSVIFTLLLQTNDIRLSTVFTNVVTTNGMIVTTNTVLLTVTNRVSIPGWEVLPSGSDNQPTWFQTYPTYVLGQAESSLKIYDDDEPAFLPIVTARAVDTDAVETGNDSATVMFSRFASPIDQDLTIHFTLGGTASNGVDYLLITNSIVIPAGQTFVNLTIVAINDLFVEGNETVEITVEDDSNYFSFAQPVTVYIIDDDLPLVSIYASDSVAGKTGNNTGTLRVSRSGDLSSDLLVNYLVTGTAVAGVDYLTLSGSVTIPAGQITANITVTPISNSPAGTKTVTLLVSDSPSYNIHNLNKATVTIQDILPTVALSVADANATEAAGGARSFTVTRTGGNTNSALVVYFAVGGSALEQADYAAIGTNVTIPAGATTANIVISPIEDPFNELRAVSGYDNVIIQLLGGTNYLLSGTSSGTITIGDNDGADLPAIGFLARNSSGREDSGFAQLWFRLSSNPATNKPVRVSYRITSGTAANNVNYSFTGTGVVEVLHFNPPKPPDPFHDIEGGIDRIVIPLLEDGVAAGNKSFTVTFFNYVGYITNEVYVTNNAVRSTNTFIIPYPTNYYLGDYRAHTFTILDVGVNVVSIEPTTPLAYEEGAVPGLFTISRQGPTTSPLTVFLDVNGSAASGNDYVALPASVTIPAGTNRVLLPLIPIDDPTEEYAENVVVTLRETPGMSLGFARAEIIIVDNDGTIQFTKSGYEVSESETNATISVLRTGNTSKEAKVDYLVFDGTARSPGDYLSPTNGTLTFAIGESIKTISIPIVNDFVVEPQETVSLVLTNPTGGVPLGGQRNATLFINDDDTLFVFSTNQFTVNENGTNAIINVLRFGLTNLTSSVNFSTSDSTATNGLDYMGTNGMTLVFEPGETNKFIYLPILDDDLFEGGETVRLRLANPSTNTYLGTISNSTLVIFDDECRVEFAATNYSVLEYQGVVTVEVRRNGGTVNPFSVSYFSTDGTATGTGTSNLDYVAKSGVLDFAGDQYVQLTNGSGIIEFHPGESNKFISFLILDDVAGEGNEFFTVTLSDLVVPSTGLFSSNSLVIGTTNRTVVTIVDNETAGNVDYEYSFGSGANGPVLALALQSDLKTVFGGQFTLFNGISFNRIARLQADGYLDNSFNPGAGANGSVYAVASQPDLKVLLGGAFTSVDSTNRTNIARLNANGNLDLSFNPGTGPNNIVRAIAVQADGKVVIGGDFTSVNGFPRSRIARLNEDGSVDGSFSATANLPVYALAVESNGKILVGGAFTSISGSSNRFVAQLNANGSIDTGFDVGMGLDGVVNSVAVQLDGKVVLGGNFRSVNGINSYYIARLLTSGQPDPIFDIGSGPDQPVKSVAVHANGKIIVGGDFTTINGIARNRFARLKSSGTVDPVFNPSSGANDTVNAVVVQPDTAVIIGGNFTTVNNLSRNRIARIHGDDRFISTVVEFAQPIFYVTEDAGFALITVRRSGNTNTAFTVDFDTANGTALAGSDYFATNGTLNFGLGETTKTFTVGISNDTSLELDETIVLHLRNAPANIDLNDTGLLVIKDDEKSVQFSTNSFTVIERGMNALITVIRSGSLTGTVTVAYAAIGGSATALVDFTNVSGTLTFNPSETSKTFQVPIIDDFKKELDETVFLVLSNVLGGASLGTYSNATLVIKDDDFGPGSPDTSFDPGTGANSFVRSIAVQGDGRILLGGAFTNFAGVDRHYVTRLNTNGTLDLTFNPGSGANGIVSSVSTNLNGKIIIAGSFSAVNGTNRNRIAHLLPDGKLDSTLAQSNGLNAAVYSAVAGASGKAVVGGAFTTPMSGVSRLRADGSVDVSFFPGAGANGAVFATLVQTNGKVIIGGDFTLVNNLPRTRIARLATDGSLDESFSPPTIVTGAIFAVALQVDGKVLIGGDFTFVNGTNLNRIARLNADGSLDSTFNPTGGADATVYAVAAQFDGKVLIGGDFTSVNRTNRNRIARLNADGSLDLGFEPGTGANNTVYSIAPLLDGKVLIGGNFTLVNGLARKGIARLTGDEPLGVAFQPGYGFSAQNQFILFFTCQPGLQYAVDASTNLSNPAGWIPLGTNTAIGSTLGFTDTNTVPPFPQRFYRVRQVSP